MSPYRPIAASRNSFDSPSRAEYSAAIFRDGICGVARVIAIFVLRMLTSMLTINSEHAQNKNGANFKSL